MDNQKFGKFIKELRKKANLTQKELGEKLNITDKAISKWERGLSFPDITMINSLAKIFGITETELLNSELGQKDNLNIDEVIKQAINKYKNKEEKRKKKIKKVKIIIGIISLILFLISLGIQIIHIFIAKNYGFEYVIDIIPYILNEIAIITMMLFVLLLIKKSKIKNIIISVIFIMITTINVIVLLNNGLKNECIVSISADFKNELVLKKNKKTGVTTYYKNAKFYIWAKPQEQLSYEVKGIIKYSWLETDICNITYQDKNKKLRTFVATYGNRQEQLQNSYYNIIPAINGNWVNMAQYANQIKLVVDVGKIKITKNQITETFDSANCKQFGTIALVLYNNETPRYVIGLNKDCTVDNVTGLIKDGGTITICEVSKQKSTTDILYCTAHKNNNNLENYNKIFIDKNSYNIKDGKLYISYDGKTTIQVPGKFENMVYNESNYQISEEKTIFYYDYHSKRYFVYSDDMGENWITTEMPQNTTIECIQFINSKIGYMLEFEDMVMGTASGKISKTTDGGKTWNDINYGIGEAPNQEFKTSSKIKFFSENLGFLTMPQISGESSDLYITKDGGITFNKLELFESNIYDYYNLPTEENGVLKLKITQGTDGDYEGENFITYISYDNGENWII